MPELDLSQFTHTFDIQFKADGSHFLKGQVEFNIDGKVSFYVKDSSIPLDRDALTHFTELMSLLKTVFYSQEGIKKVEIVQKPTP